MSEAVHLRVPMLSIPLQKQFEQELNARYLEKLGYGAWSATLDADVIMRFLGGLEDHSAALQSYPAQDNSMMLTCVEELLRDVVLDEPRPVRLESEAMGKFWAPPLPEDSS
jgi:UDP:flavonoid glycosyltransferase YjiC (YdhE family)